MAEAATHNATSVGDVSDETGFFLAYGALFIMAVVPIYIGSWTSLGKKQEAQTITHKEAAMFPIYASAALFGLYLVFKVFISRPFLGWGGGE